MHRLVTDRHGRLWRVGAQVRWRGERGVAFELDETSSRAAAVVGGVLAVLIVALLASAPTNLFLPGWAVGPLLVAAVVALLSWCAKRPVEVAAAPVKPGVGVRAWSGSAVGAWPGWRLHAAVVGSLTRRGRPDPSSER